MTQTGPSKTIETLVALLIPPACREEVLGDLCERFVSPGRYFLDAVRTIPLVIFSRIRRTADPQMTVIHAFMWYLAFVVAARLNDRVLFEQPWGLLRPAIPTAMVMVGIMFQDAYARRGSVPLPRLARGPAAGTLLAILSGAMKRSVLVDGYGIGMMFSLAIWYIVPPPWRKDRRGLPLVLLVGLLLLPRAGWCNVPTVSYSEFLEQVRSGRVARATLFNSAAGATPADYELRDGERGRTVLPRDYQYALSQMQDYDVNVEIRDPSSGPGRILLNAAPFLVLLAVWIVLMIRGGPILRGRL
jgi:hypothetical protein